MTRAVWHSPDTARYRTVTGLAAPTPPRLLRLMMPVLAQRITAVPVQTPFVAHTLLRDPKVRSDLLPDFMYRCDANAVTGANEATERGDIEELKGRAQSDHECGRVQMPVPTVPARCDALNQLQERLVAIRSYVPGVYNTFPGRAV